MKLNPAMTVSSVSDDDPIDDLFPASFALGSNNIAYGNAAALSDYADNYPSQQQQPPLPPRPAFNGGLSTGAISLRPYPSSLTPSRSIPSSLGTFIIDDAASGTGGAHIIDDVGPEPGFPKRYTELRRTLSTRHIQMIALGGVLGNGLFIGTGKILGNSGPLGMILGFLITGAIVFSVMVSFGEMVALIPIAGGISAFGSRFVDDALGFALGLCYWFSLAIAIPTQVASAAVLVTYFAPFDPWHIPPAALTVSFLFVIILINALEVRIYGEIEYVFGQLKLILLLSLIIVMFVLNRGHIPPQYGKTTIFPVNFLYWNSAVNSDYGPFRPAFEVTPSHLIGGSTGTFLMVWTAVVQSVYCFSGTELVALTAGEARHPRKSLPRATLRIFFRIFILYMLGVFAIGMNVAAGNNLLPSFFTPWRVFDSQQVSWVYSPSQGGNCMSGVVNMKGFSNSNSSPWVIALQNGGHCVGAAVVTCCFVFCAWSAGNSFLYASSRTLYALAVQGKFPRVFQRCTKRGVPIISVLFTFMIAMTVFLVSFPNSTAITVYYWIRRLTSVPGTLVWAGICLSYIRFYCGLQLRPDIVQRDMPSYPYRSPFQPYTAYFGLMGCVLLVIFNDMTIFIQFEWQYLFASYVSLVLFLLCFLGYKFWRRTRIVPLSQLDLDLGRREMDQYEAETAAELGMMEKGIWGRGKRIWYWIKVLTV
ncbi:amino acid permease-domain-containing protein [Lipomyces kononenkoae]|uniref:Amino acid permease-domain-containing protein n=1 Tax=Lipomyces kononenkoae TaxID=34357 RepID=A0ACC3T1Q2_LIPKO